MLLVVKSIRQIPDHVCKKGVMGSKLRALAHQMVSQYGLSRRELQRFFATHLNFSMSSGLIYKMKREWLTISYSILATHLRISAVVRYKSLGISPSSSDSENSRLAK
jgi:histone acetyltransferase (RNA polymerase elongator complex component)